MQFFPPGKNDMSVLFLGFGLKRPSHLLLNIGAGNWNVVRALITNDRCPGTSNECVDMNLRLSFSPPCPPRIN